VKNQHMTMDPTVFEQQLASQGQTYQAVTTWGNAGCQLRFTGPFQGVTIVWDAYLHTLAYYVNEHSLKGQSMRQFIEVGDVGENGRRIRIGLNLSLIDEPVILKSIIMVRQYRRLAPGRHEFGESVDFPK
jgi:hypothetical protein